MNSKMPTTLINVLKHLYKMSYADGFAYSQLALILPPQAFFDLIRVFGGTRLYIPTKEEFNDLLLFCLVEEIGNYEVAVAANPEILNGFTKSRYEAIADQVYQRTKPAERPSRDRKRAARRRRTLAGKEDGRKG